ncbi:MAG TPA: acyl carrier protein [Jatrophihabitans sp.]|jgi:acyl carrier protein|nr:acyl carrier protein [Jatrophihabitans sp.]
MTPTDVTELMRELLGTDEIAVDDNFFDMGGSSVMALRLLLEMDKRYGVTLSLLDVMHNPTPQGLARRLSDVRSEASGAPQPGGPA